MYSPDCLSGQRLHGVVRFSRDTPLGTPSNDVRAFLEQRGWLDHNYAGTTGFYRQEPGEPPRVIGVSSLHARLGYYYLSLRTDVTAYWGFDDNGRLVDVWVRKTVNTL